ncbi:TonB-dependent receptor domain-containing protein [Microbulbifer pacificus]|uniref:TonB-dependent receptor n=1 Tax=Microbulbifer pacificus TaxID=407164 RepID=A0AAU0MXE5_9GAMM|nr:TonB-dependent receptor [Microbulbifer pacificus]WOX04788.1 TonB-dependent receptor [Microbulbifer pacificus]
MKKNLLSLAVKGALGLTAAAIMVPAMPAFAQEDEAQAVEEVIVTGSRLRVSQTQTATSPVTEINAEEFAINGATTVEDLVNQYPQLDMNFDNFMNNGSYGYASVSLRNLGAERTLTLVNGRRLPSGTYETTDLSIVPAAMVKRVDVMSGGASAVYGADAVAGVVNFELDDEFEGVGVNVGWQGYQHKNDNKYMQGLLDDAGYDYPTGSGVDGGSNNLDVMFGTSFAEKGNFVGYVTYRENEALMQGDRDYSSCALGHSSTSRTEYCGGSATANPGNFLVDGSWYTADGDGSFTPGRNVYNYAPINFYQRPDERYTAGFIAKYEVNEHFTPYTELMYVQRKSGVQIAESGTFGAAVTVPCDSALIGSLCADAGITDETVTARLYKRNTEGGPRLWNDENESYRFVIGGNGEINDNWTYDASLTYGENSAESQGYNDFLFSRIADAATGCQAGSFEGCLPYDIWNNNISVEAANALAAVSWQNIDTTFTVLQAYASGDLGFGLPSAKGETIGLVAGVEYRENTFTRASDANSLAGEFAGAGGADTNLDASIDVTEVFFESSIPLLADMGALNSFGAELGYRYSDYSTSGGVSTFKLGLSARFAEDYLVRASWNRAIRAATLNDLYTPATMALWSGTDPCAGEDPEATFEQCARTGVTAEMYGNIDPSPAGQYNMFSGGNDELTPEDATTFTFGVAATPVDNLNLAIDYYNIEVEDVISTVGASTKLNACLSQGLFCSDIRRDTEGTGTGDLWVGNSTEVATAGMIFNQIGNNGIMEREGIDLSASYSFDMGVGSMTASFVTTYVLKDYFEPIPGDESSSYDCAGLVNVSCHSPEWRHIANLRYNLDSWSVGMRWRHIGGAAFEDQYSGELLGYAADPYLSSGGRGLDSYDYLDLSAAVETTYGTLTLGINNVWDKEPPLVGVNLSENGNALGGYDQAGRYMFTSFNARF